MILPLFRRPKSGGTISGLYGMIVAQARLPCFYRDYGVPDTVNGRFDLLVAHLAAVLQRLDPKDPQLRELGQGLFDEFCRDMDHNLREMGVGDLSVPKEMNRIGEAFYGRSQVYAQASAARDNQALSRAYGRNIFGDTAESPGARRLASYMNVFAADLAALDRAALLGGELNFPDPSAIPPPEER
ncbi:MAG: ubiquinol-cytochrome C chaperone [Pseudolabrys sp.]|nr:ubiquinol-cytochrome C chaperone [Pseudolabrys sp.]